MQQTNRAKCAGIVDKSALLSYTRLTVSEGPSPSTGSRSIAAAEFGSGGSGRRCGGVTDILMGTFRDPATFDKAVAFAGQRPDKNRGVGGLQDVNSTIQLRQPRGLNL